MLLAVLAQKEKSEASRDCPTIGVVPKTNLHRFVLSNFPSKRYRATFSSAVGVVSPEPGGAPLPCIYRIWVQDTFESLTNSLDLAQEPPEYPSGGWCSRLRVVRGRLQSRES